jgi:hypothetical protein
MPRRLFSLACLCLLGGGAALAQEAEFREDLRFVEALRKRKDHKLALQLLERIAKNAPAELAQEMPLELAKTQFEAAGEEADSARRLELYKKARLQLEDFIAKHPAHKRVAEANIDVARVLNLQGKTELSRAKINDDRKSRLLGAKQARATLEDAGKRLKAAAIAQEKRLLALKEGTPEYSQLEEQLRGTKLDIALNLYSQYETFFSDAADDGTPRLTDADNALKELMDGEDKSPVKWTARAWKGRFQEVLGRNADDARNVYKDMARAPKGDRSPEGFRLGEGRRLSAYFHMDLNYRTSRDLDKKKRPAKLKELREEAEEWRTEVFGKWGPRAMSTYEAQGVAYILAQLYLEQANTFKKGSESRTKLHDRARALLTELEISENDFTEDARRLKLNLMFAQGLFGRPVEKLTSFEDCYIRTEYELSKFQEEAKKATTAEELKKTRDKHAEVIIPALTRGLTMPDVTKKALQTQVGKAKVTLTYWCLITGKLKEAITHGEAIARGQADAHQADLAACYALDAYGRLVTQLMQKGGLEDAAEERSAMFRLARLMEQRWKNEHAGDMARHEIGLQMLREKNYPEAIKRLSAVSPNYRSFARARGHLAFACRQAENEKLPPLIGERGKREDGTWADGGDESVNDYRRRSLIALSTLPESLIGPDPETNTSYVAGKAAMLREGLRPGRYAETKEGARALLTKLPRADEGEPTKGTLRFDDDPKEDRKKRAALRLELVYVTLYADYKLADAAFNAKNHERVLEIVGPVVAEVSKSADTPEKVVLKSNSGLGTAMLSLALKSNIQLGHIEKTEEVLAGLDAISEEPMPGAGPNNVLKLLAFLIRRQVDEVRKSGDNDALKKAIAGYTKLLDKQIAKQKGVSADFQEVLAGCYSSMGQHGKAAVELGKIPLPKSPAAGSNEERMLRRVTLMRVRELRLSGTPKNLDKALAEIEKIMSSWGKRVLDAHREYGMVLECHKRWPDAFRVWSPLVKNLNKTAPTDQRIKEIYLDCYYHMTVCMYKHGQTQATPAARAKYTKQARGLIVTLKKSWGDDFGSEASKKRFEDFLAQEPALRR